MYVLSRAVIQCIAVRTLHFAVLVTISETVEKHKLTNSVGFSDLIGRQFIMVALCNRADHYIFAL